MSLGNRIFLDLGPKNIDGKYFCECCKQEVECEDQFGLAGLASYCWDCSFGTNLRCEACVEQGVALDYFHIPTKKSKLHRMKKWEQEDAITCCGKKIPGDDIGQGVFVVENYCKVCWPNET